MIRRNDISEKKTFERNGYRYDQVLADHDKHLYLYKMTPLKWEQTYPQYELVKGKKYKNPDGSIVHVYPSDEDFGTFGWYICGRPEYVSLTIASKWLSFTNYIPDFSVYR